jgi:hypothetical protein
MRLLALMLLLPVLAHAQDGWIGNWVGGPAPAAAVAGGPSGLPGVLTYGKQGSGTTVSNWVDLTVSGANTWMLFFQDWYNSANTNNVPTWNGSAAGVTLITNNFWFGTAGKMQCYALSNPAPGSLRAAILYPNTAAGEATFHVVVLTNCSGLGAASGEFIASSTSYTNSVASTTNSLVIGLADNSSGGSVGVSSLGSDQTSLGYTNSLPANGHASTVWHKVGTGVSTNSVIWNAAAAGGMILINGVGF